MTTRRTLLLLAVTIGACHPSRSELTAERCSPVNGPLAANATAEGLVGAFRLTLVATQGPRSGATIQGSLALTRADTVHYGSAEVPLDSVGALRIGDIAAADPAAPGVRVLASPGDILLRLGSEANRAGQMSFDGGYTVLRVREVRPDGFRGVWASGVTEEQASGFFCAWRAAS